MRNRIIGHIKILVGIAAGPGILLILPLILTPSDYGQVFGFISTIQLISLFSSIGLEIVASRINLPLTTSLAILTLTTLFVTAIYSLYTSQYLSHWVTIFAFSVALLNNFSLVIQNQYLFKGDINSYSLFGVCRSAILIVILLACIHGEIGAITSWFVSSVLSVAISYFVLNLNKKTLSSLADDVWSFSLIKNVLFSGLPMSVLNSLAGLPFVSEKLIAKSSFPSDLFPKYAVCATLLSPLVYIGNMAQNQIISNNKKITKHIAVDGAKLIFILGLLYIGALFLFINFVHPPYIVNSIEFYMIATPSALWMLFYCTLIFPLAAIMQKHAKGSGLTRCAITSIASICSLYLIYQLIMKYGIRMDLPWKSSTAISVLSVFILTARAYYIWPLSLLVTPNSMGMDATHDSDQAKRDSEG
ncbi:hypothetical protein [Ferrovum sp.]|uniref:hypothetical protein n=1 Tax=Ferrovum sp. TaxID=2609467 RepID=UPI00261D1F7C|nr:hypothetical protein [Ferrovum sp.]